ncbi:hypothetical protein [Rhizobium sp. WW_1]|uniref:hypothetical protein n=1 Tax=Rhizobium sp. WW_1 TaxID=1907375 RepID=UPI0006479952|nr:hypothetical protein [Rhizobium sp. WW_1]RKD61532.1 hypothetical protein BJ928_107133 [Rhizobium sp. WW_1]
MKRLFCAVAIFVSLAGGTHADERQDAIETLARVLAFQKLCPRIELDLYGPVVPLVASYGINLDVDQDRREVFAEARRQEAPWAGKTEQAICSTALTLYGPNGKNERGLLKEK